MSYTIIFAPAALHQLNAIQEYITQASGHPVIPPLKTLVPRVLDDSA